MAWLENWPIRFALVALAAILWLAAVPPSRAAVDPLLVDRARAAIAAGDAAGGFALIEDAIADRSTSEAMRVDLLGELARLRSTRSEFAGAGDALALQAELTARLRGASTPELASLYAAASDAYARAGDLPKALTFAREALEVDAAYYGCADDVIAADHARLADLFERMGETTRAAAERRLAGSSPTLRCAGDRSGPGARPVVVTSDIGEADENSFARVKVFYATDRARSGSDRPNDFYGGERGEMDYGTLEVTVPRIHKPGSIEAPSVIKLEWSENPERHFVISRIATKTGDGMFADLRSTLAERKSDEAFVFIHGFNVTFAAAAKRTAQIAYDLNFDGAPILFSWPSDGSAFSYIRDEAVIRLSGRRLLRFLDELVAHSGAKSINLIAHSMGNRALLDALELMAARREGAGQTGKVFNQVVFAAPDEDAALFAEMLTAIRPLAERLTLYGSDRDLALTVSRGVHGAMARAGEAGDDIVVSPALDSIDMTVLGDDMLAHSYFADTSSALTDLLWLFWRDAPPQERCGLEPEEGMFGRFWQFRPNHCNGAAMLSALTMLKAEGKAALERVNGLLDSADNRGASASKVEEWRAIRNAIAALTAVPN